MLTEVVGASFFANSYWNLSTNRIIVQIKRQSIIEIFFTFLN